MDMTVSVAKALADIAGPELAGACASFGWLHYGSLVVTEGYKLPCNFIVHCNAYFKKDDQDCKVYQAIKMSVVKMKTNTEHCTAPFRM